jgi:preprotein translocase subunit SecD
MNPNLKWKFLLIFGVILLCVYGLIGLPKFPTTWNDVQENFAQRLKKGLDLQGGTHLILQVQMQEAISQYTDQTRDRLDRSLRDDKKIRYGAVRKEGDTQIIVSDVAPEQSTDFARLITESYANEWESAPAPGTTNGYLLTLRPSEIARLQGQVMEQSVETIRRRIDQLGLTEPDIREHGRGDFEILVQLPGEADPRRAKEVIRAGGQLELRLVAGDRQYSSEADCLASHGGVLPQGTECVRGSSEGRQAASTAGGEAWYLLERRPAVTGTDLRNATTSPSSKYPGYYSVNFSLSTQAGRRFGQITEQNIGRQLAIVLDRSVHSAPQIDGRIEDQGEITGRFSQTEAHDLALVLRAGALPASIKYLEERTVGPSLGADSIRQGLQASLISLVVVIVFMVFYYRLAGVNAVVALFLNLLVLLACLAYFRAVLTLPGIAGVILTIGMGVDSNVLVFERIREELRAGKAPSSAVEAGFDRAILTIIDTHVTTVVSCLFLFIFGTGPVRGFAVSLVIGLIANLFTAVYVSRVMFAWHLARMPRDARLSI